MPRTKHPNKTTISTELSSAESFGAYRQLERLGNHTQETTSSGLYLRVFGLLGIGATFLAMADSGADAASSRQELPSSAVLEIVNYAPKRPICATVNPDTGNCIMWIDIDDDTVPPPTTRTTSHTNTTSPQRPPVKTWEQTVAERCLDQPNNDILAESLDAVRATDGSGRLVIYARECGLSFVGDVVPDLGRPMTNVEWAVLDPANNITPNQAQLDILRASADAQWLLEHPELATTTTLAPTTTTTTMPTTTSTTATTIAPSTTPASTSTQVPTTIKITDIKDSNSGSGASESILVGLAMAGAGAFGLLGVLVASRRPGKTQKLHTTSRGIYTALHGKHH